MNRTLQISTKEQLKAFRNRVNDGENYLYAELLNDIDLEGEEWEPIGNCYNYFHGDFDGNGYTISNLKITQRIQDLEHPVPGLNDVKGLFGRLSGTVKNVKVSGSIDAKNILGGITGILRSGSIVNCENYVNITGSEHVGGICGFITSGTIDGCSNHAILIGKTPCGITGYTPFVRETTFGSKITNCTNDGEIRFNVVQDFDVIRNNHFRYNQIGGIVEQDRSNHQNGRVITESHNSLLGAYLKTYNFFAQKQQKQQTNFDELFEADPNTEYVNDDGETYLHLLCQNQTLHYATIGGENIRQTLPNLIIKLAEKTKIDFGMINKDGKEATAFLKNSNTGRTLKGLGDIVKLINEIKKDKERIRNGQDPEEENFSEIGW